MSAWTRLVGAWRAVDRGLDRMVATHMALTTQTETVPPHPPGPTQPPASGPDTTVVHRWPGAMWAPTWCCDQRPRDLPDEHRYSTNQKIVTCPGAAR